MEVKEQNIRLTKKEAEAIRELKILKEDLWYDDGYGKETEQYGKTMLALDVAIEAIEQKPKPGKWVGIAEYCKHLEEEKGERYQPSGMGNNIYCNQCWSGTIRKDDFCPNCGADMRGVDEVFINALPSAQPLTAYVISDEDGNIKCSNCGSSECWGNYCMDCGAKMKKEVEKESKD